MKTNLTSTPSRSVRAALSLSLLASAAAAVAACGGGTLGEAVRPNAPSAASAMQSETSDALIACKPGSYAEPLVVDLSASARVDFEAAMDSGVALVNYDCKAVRLLKDCRLSGDYRFAGVSRKEEVIHLDNRDEIKANLPISASVKAGGELERASALDIAYVLVGKRTTSAQVTRATLEGSQCGEATHYIRAATVGAFAVQSSTKGRVAAAAEVFGASTSGQSGSEKQNSKKDGDPRSCEQSKPDANTPPGECRSAIRFELVPVSDKAPVSKEADKGKGGAKGGDKGGDKGGKDDVQNLEDPCPEGFQLAGGKCAKKGGDVKLAHLCDPKDLADCETQCAANHPGSCHNLANLAYRDYGKSVSDAETRKNEDRALELWKKACEGGVNEACYEFGEARMSKTGTQAPDFALGNQYLTRACNNGNADACYSRADLTLEGKKGVAKSATDGFTLLARACKLGERIACLDMGEYLFAGKHGIPRDPASADKLLSAFCKQGIDGACYDLAEHLLGIYDDDDKPARPVSEISDAKKRGYALLDQVCKSDRPRNSCVVLGRLLTEDGDARGRALLTEQCNGDKGDSCLILGRALVSGKGGPVDKAKGVELLLKSKDDDGMFEAAQLLDKGDGVKKDAAKAKQILTKLCKSEEHKPSCEALKK